jgi:hypothetical protein
MAFDPISSVLLGTLLLHEKIHESGPKVTGSLVALLLALVGLVLLARSQGQVEGAKPAPVRPRAAQPAPEPAPQPADP